MGPVEVISIVRTVTASIVRPANATVYAAGDVVTSDPVAVFTFKDVGLGKLASCWLMGARLISSANQATKLEGRLFLFDTTISDLDADNAAFTPTDAQLRTVRHVIQFPAAAWVAGDATAGAGGNALCDAQGLWLPLNTASDSRDLFGVLQAQNAYTPVSGEQFDLHLTFVK